jgi:hypothetical protein
MGRVENNLSRRRGVYADTLDGSAIAQCRLKPKPHLQLHPDLRPALIRVVGGDAKRSRCTPHRYPKLPIVRPPAAAKKPDDGS